MSHIQYETNSKRLIQEFLIKGSDYKPFSGFYHSTIDFQKRKKQKLEKKSFSHSIFLCNSKDAVFTPYQKERNRQGILLHHVKQRKLMPSPSVQYQTVQKQSDENKLNEPQKFQNQQSMNSARQEQRLNEQQKFVEFNSEKGKNIRHDGMFSTHLKSYLYTLFKKQLAESLNNELVLQTDKKNAILPSTPKPSSSNQQNNNDDKQIKPFSNIVLGKIQKDKQEEQTNQSEEKLTKPFVNIFVGKQKTEEQEIYQNQNDEKLQQKPFMNVLLGKKMQNKSEIQINDENFTNESLKESQKQQTQSKQLLQKANTPSDSVSTNLRLLKPNTRETLQSDQQKYENISQRQSSQMGTKESFFSKDNNVGNTRKNQFSSEYDKKENEEIRDVRTTMGPNKPRADIQQEDSIEKLNNDHKNRHLLRRQSTKAYMYFTHQESQNQNTQIEQNLFKTGNKQNANPIMRQESQKHDIRAKVESHISDPHRNQNFVFKQAKSQKQVLDEQNNLYIRELEEQLKQPNRINLDSSDEQVEKQMYM